MVFEGNRPSTCKTEPQTQVQSALDLLNERIGSALQAWELICKRLAPLTRFGSEDACDPEKSLEVVDLAKWIQESRVRIESLVGSMKSVLERLEL